MITFANICAHLRGSILYLTYKPFIRRAGFPLKVWGDTFIENIKNISLGFNVTFASRCYISPLDLHIGDNTWIGYNCFLVGQVIIGRNVMIGPNVAIVGANHEIRRNDIPMINAGLHVKGIEIGDDVWIGANAVILDGVIINKGAVIGAGAIITRDVAAYDIVAGNPAKSIGNRREAN
jgi:maltose O-acetyltransferase